VDKVSFRCGLANIYSLQDKASLCARREGAFTREGTVITMVKVLSKGVGDEDYNYRRTQAVKEARDMKQWGRRVAWKILEGKYGIPRENLRYYVDRTDGPPRTRAEACRARGKVLPEENALLEDWILEQNVMGVYPTKDALYAMANSLVNQRQLREHRPLENLKSQWPKSWLIKHRHVTKEKIRAIVRALLEGYTRGSCEEYFKALEETLKLVDDDLIYNFDDTGFIIGDTTRLREKRQTDTQTAKGERKFIAPSGRQEWLTVIECIRSNGTAIKPFIITKSPLPGNLQVLNDYTLAQTSSEWIRNDAGVLQWLKEHFDPITKDHALREDGSLRPRLLIFDGYGSHSTNDFVEYCLQMNILPLRLPPCTAWKLQPLDVAVFGAYKENLLECQAEWFEAAKRRIHTQEFIDILLEERKRAMTPENILAGFQKAAIFPFDGNYFSRIPQSRQRPSKDSRDFLKDAMAWISRVLRLNGTNFDLEGNNGIYLVSNPEALSAITQTDASAVNDSSSDHAEVDAISPLFSSQGATTLSA
jgi:hypothetical protein